MTKLCWNPDREAFVPCNKPSRVPPCDDDAPCNKLASGKPRLSRAQPMREAGCCSDDVNRQKLGPCNCIEDCVAQCMKVVTKGNTLIPGGAQEWCERECAKGCADDRKPAKPRCDDCFRAVPPAFGATGCPEE
jgi:hypothetical protein